MNKIHVRTILVSSILMCAAIQTLAEEPVQTADQKDRITVAAYYYPGFHPNYFEKGGTPLVFLPRGEWDRVRNCKPRFEGHWQPRVPLWGHELENEPAAMEKKIDAAVKYGVNCFVFDWFWVDNKPNRDGALNDAFYNAKNNDQIDFYLMWANAPYSRDSRGRPYPLPVFKTVVDRVINTHFKHPSYYKIDGKPVFSIYDLPVFMQSFGSVAQAKDALDYFRSEVKKAGFPGLHVQFVLQRIAGSDSAGYDSQGVVSPADIKTLAPDSLTHYQWIHVLGALDDYIEWADVGVQAWYNADEEYDIPYIPQVSIGWDSHSRAAPDVTRRMVKENVNPQVFKRYLEKAKTYVENHPNQQRTVIINSWNEWVEGSYLEPDQRFGFGYLEAVRDVFGAE